MKTIWSVLLLCVLALGGCQWSSFREHLKPSSTRIKKTGEGREERRAREKKEIIGVRAWKGKDGRTYIQPVYRGGGDDA